MPGSNAIFLMVGAALAIYGTYVVNGLRSELHEAKKFGQYQIREKIGVGGMGEVYLAEHQLLKRPCALKLIRGEAGADPIALARFEREVQSAAQALASQHDRNLRLRPHRRRHILLRDGIFVRDHLHDLVKQDGPLPDRPGDLSVSPGLRRAGRGPFAGPGPPRFEAGERFRRDSRGRGRRRQDSRLWPGETHERHERRRADERPEGQRNPALHVARAGDRRPLARRPRRHLRPRLHDLLRFDRPAAVSRDDAVRGDDGARRAIRSSPPSQIRRDVPADLEQIVLKCLAKKPEARYAAVVALGKAGRLHGRRRVERREGAGVVVRVPPE